MKFSVALSEFQKLLQTVIQAVPPKSTLPVLENFHFTLTGNFLQAIATDQELTISSALEVDGNDNGAMLVPARKLSDIVKALGNTGMITFIGNKDRYKITLKTNYGEYTMFGQDPDDFPNIPSFTKGVSVHIAKDDMTKIANKTAFAVSKDEYRPAMTGVLFQFKAEELCAVATDAYRLARIKIASGNGTILPDQNHEAIIPARTVELLKKLDGDIDLLMTETHAKFIAGGTTIITRIIDEKFPAYESVIPSDNTKEVKFRPADLLSSVKRVALFSSAVSRQIRLALDGNSWTITGEDVESGNKAVETIPCEYNGDALEIGFNYRYIEEALGHLTDSANEEAVMTFSAPTRPALLKIVRDGQIKEDVLMLIMPVRL